MISSRHVWTLYPKLHLARANRALPADPTGDQSAPALQHRPDDGYRCREIGGYDNAVRRNATPASRTSRGSRDQFKFKADSIPGPLAGDRIEAAKNVVMMDVALLNAEIKRHVQEARRNPRKRNPLRAACTRRPRRYSPKLAQLRIAADRPHRGDGA